MKYVAEFYDRLELIGPEKKEKRLVYLASDDLEVLKEAKSK
jgi:hypothetical protein